MRSPSPNPAFRPRVWTYPPSNQMMVIALGRLGMREFDLASDADLVFVIPDADAHEMLFWTGVAERMINVISAYTGDGVVFTIDTRLRPNGREGALVQTEGTYKDYFALSRRGVGRHLVHEGARRAGQYGTRHGVSQRTAEGRLAPLRPERPFARRNLPQMRARLEREQGARNPLKAASGGYYDIDFVLMYLRLERRGLVLQGAEHPATDRRHRKDGAPRSRGCRSFCATPLRSIAPSITGCAFRPDMRKAGSRPIARTWPFLPILFTGGHRPTCIKAR